MTEDEVVERGIYADNVMTLVETFFEEHKALLMQSIVNTPKEDQVHRERLYSEFHIVDDVFNNMRAYCAAKDQIAEKRSILEQTKEFDF